MKKFLIFTLFASVLTLPGVAIAQSNSLGACMVDSLNGKQRKLLAKWIFLSMASHPDLKPYSKITDQEVMESDQYIGGLITSLLVGQCPEELKESSQDDPLAVENAFGLVGQVAMRELMANQDVMRAMVQYSDYTDHAAIERVLTTD
ncbi:hypothetical protein NCG89_11140 [Spongiibacter taiwanensis]|uniref:hypothetical protein n=1 Tax=Spongiibacter taiwanensis TaxID=1748242 RepID=UPI0020364DD5|nr:hypothetical protein [Spongiibacter taiwanensis]USA42077.1 hypothetical protein NCG89_11140 [Spongiibacter taiwanensis]